MCTSNSASGSRPTPSRSATSRASATLFARRTAAKRSRNDGVVGERRERLEPSGVVEDLRADRVDDELGEPRIRLVAASGGR